jgi:hypothetical protein
MIGRTTIGPAMIKRLKRLFQRRPPAISEPSTYHKFLAVHIATTTRSAGRTLWP